jgi:hypothetical protein
VDVQFRRSQVCEIDKTKREKLRWEEKRRREEKGTEGERKIGRGQREERKK